MKSRKLLTVLLCLFLLVGLVPVNVWAQDEPSEPGEKTGDSSHTRDYAIISSLSALCLAYLFICLNKRKKLQK